MSLINLMNRIDIALHCLEAAKSAFDNTEGAKKPYEFPADIADFKEKLDVVVDQVYDLAMAYDLKVQESNRETPLKLVN